MTVPAGRDDTAADTPGRLIAGRYRLARVIATGGMGQVWRGYDEHFERPVAVKVLRPEFAAEHAFVERFRAEARTAGRLEHPNIAAVVDYGEQTGPHGEPTGAYLVMELVEGEPLSAILRRESPLGTDRVLGLLTQAGAGLQAAHDGGVVHRDVKPANLLVTPDGRLKITDFGIARAAGALSLTRTGTVLGTAHYLSPEQVQGHSASPASDLYALGVVAYECLAGHRPYEGDSPLEVALAHQRDPVPSLPPGVPPAVAALVLRAMAKDPAQRHRSAGAFGRTAAALRETLAGSPAPARVPPLPPPPVAARAVAARPRRRVTLRLPLLVLGGLLLAALVVALVGGRHQPPHPRTVAHPSATSSGLAVNPRAYAGEPAATAVARLRSLGLVPTTQEVADPGTPGTVVTIVSGDGAPLPAALPAGSAVVVQVVARP